MLPVTSTQNPTIKIVRSLSDKKGRREHGLFVAEGMQMLERALALGWKPEHLIATRPPHLWDDVKPTLVSEKLMAEISAQNNPHDVLATFKQRYVPQPPREGLVLALEEIRDPGNLGTILRTADAAGVTGTVLAGDCCDPYAPECVRASTGSVFASTLTRMPSDKLVDHIKGWPGDTVATSMTAKDSFRRSYSQPVLVVMGSEARGISAAVLNACKRRVHIPMREGVESLNIAISTALMLYEIGRA